MHIYSISQIKELIRNIILEYYNIMFTVHGGYHAHNIFTPGLIRGAEKLAFAPHKKYAYVEHPFEGWRGYLRSCALFYNLSKPWDPTKFLVVKRTGADSKGKSWEPPKGQMEGKDINMSSPMSELLLENIRREVEEEAGIHFNDSDLKRIHYSGLFYESRESDYPPGHYFQYHIFIIFVTQNELDKAYSHFEWITQHPAAFARFRSDRREKDAIAWYSQNTRMMGKWSPKIVPMYLQKMWGIII
jgi:8-oxo-dGTP pyrophosphatase MutT (NUDIX family)